MPPAPASLIARRSRAASSRGHVHHHLAKPAALVVRHNGYPRCRLAQPVAEPVVGPAPHGVERGVRRVHRGPRPHRGEEFAAASTARRRSVAPTARRSAGGKRRSSWQFFSAASATTASVRSMHSSAASTSCRGSPTCRPTLSQGSARCSGAIFWRAASVLCRGRVIAPRITGCRWRSGSDEVARGSALIENRGALRAARYATTRGAKGSPSSAAGASWGSGDRRDQNVKPTPTA